MWPFRRKRKQQVMLAKPDSERGELVPSQLRHMQGTAGIAQEATTPCAFLDSLPADNAAPKLTDRLGD